MEWQITLSNDAALVLFDWISQRLEDWPVEGEASQAEDIALLRLQGQLETKLVEIVDPRYNELVAAARSRIVASFCFYGAPFMTKALDLPENRRLRL